MNLKIELKMVSRIKTRKSFSKSSPKAKQFEFESKVLLPNQRPRLVTNLEEVIQNIKNFNQDLSDYNDRMSDRYVNYVIENVSHYRAWYAYKDDVSGKYLFAPSKYIGYQDMNASQYVEAYAYMDGRKTEKILSEWFELLDEDNEHYDLLSNELLDVFYTIGKAINALFRINVIKREEDNELLEKDLVDLIYKVFLSLSDEGKNLVRQKIIRKN